LTDANGATAKFQFGTAAVLFQVFNLLRTLSWAVRGEPDACRKMQSIINSTARDETPFSSIEDDLPPVVGSGDVTVGVTDEATPSDSFVAVGNVLAPMRRLHERVLLLHFDIHAKLWMLFCVSFVSFCLKGIPFLPFFALCMVAFLLFTAWRSMNRDLDDVNEGKADVPEILEGYCTLQNFLGDWLFWGKPRQGIALIQWSLVVFMGWVILPGKIYSFGCLAGFVGLLLIPLVKSGALEKMAAGPWMSA
jgi:hypothetical protein